MSLLTTIRLTLWCVVTLSMLTGCTSYADRVAKSRTAYYSNDLANADKLLDEAIQADSRSADVLKLDRAMVQLVGGNPQIAERQLREVRDHFDALSGPNAVQNSWSYLTDDNRRAYPGEDYEQILVRGMLALSNLFHDAGDVEAYTLQMIDKQEQIIAAGVDKEGKNPKHEYQRVAFAPYLRGALREATHTNYDDAERSYLTVVNWQPNFTPGKIDLERAARGRHSNKGNGVLYVIALTGVGPTKREVSEVPSSVSLLIAGEMISALGDQTVTPNVASVKVPQLVAGSQSVSSVGVSINNRPVGRTETITDITGLALQQHAIVYPQIVARAVARRAVKKGMLFGTKEATGLNKNGLTNLAVDLAGVAWEASEGADLRNWTLLPDRIQVLRVELPVGEYQLNLQPLGLYNEVYQANATEAVTIADGANTFVMAAFPTPRLVGKILVSEP